MLVMKKIAVNREMLSVNRHFYDLFLDENSVRGVLMWQTGSTFRGLLASWKDKRRSARLEVLSAEELIQENELNFVVSYTDISGAVTDDLHKEIQLLTSTELINLHARKISDYEALRDEFIKHLGEKVHPRDVEVKISLEQGY